MAGIQISNLISDSAFDWKSVVDQLIAADGIPIKKLQAQQTKNSDKATALADVQKLLDTLQTSASALRDSSLFGARSVTTPNTSSTWKSASSTGAEIGTYTFAVQNLATKARINGVADVSGGLSATDDVSGTTLATLNTAAPLTAGTFTVNGKQVAVTLTDSLQDVFTKINTATGGAVTATYSAASDTVRLTNTNASTTPIVLGAANDSSNFLAAMKLGNNGNTGTITSSSSLGTLKLTTTMAASGLKASIPGAGSFTLNGVTIAFDPAVDSFSTVISRINTSAAGVSASYDSANDRFLLTNKSTGDIGIGIDDTDGLLGAMGLSLATFASGENALFSVNGGPTFSSMSNTLDATSHGITGLSVTVNTETTQAIDVSSDVAGMQAAIQAFVDNYNAVQDAITTNTKVTASGGTVSSAVLAGNREVDGWARKLRALAFEPVAGLTGSVKRLDNLGLDFDVNGKMVIKNSDKLVTALSDHPDDVQTFFQKANTGFVAKQFTYLSSIIRQDLKQQSNLTQTNLKLDEQIKLLQTRLDVERETLTNAFIRMLDAQSKAKGQNTALTNAFSSKNND